MMNGSLYISFFQGQLESTMEQVVQLAVQEITKTVGASLNSLLLETTAKDQENQRLRLRLQSHQLDCGEVGNTYAHKGGSEEDSTRQEMELLAHTPRLSSEHAMLTNTYRLEQKGQAVDQLKAVMEQVLKFAVCELTKIVEDSFDDLFLELLKKDKENKMLKQRLSEESQTGGQDGSEEVNSQQNHSQSPSNVGASEQEKETPAETPSSQHGGVETQQVTGKQTVLSVAQDWVPILDKVFGQKWCSDLWQNKELESAECTAAAAKTGAAAKADLQGFIPDKEEGLSTTQQEGSSFTYMHPSVAGGDGHCFSGEDLQLKSPSMLHRLLTVPSQGLSELLCSDEEVNTETLSTSLGASPDVQEQQQEAQLPAADRPSLREQEEGGGVEECTGDAAPAGKKNYSCKQCGRKFSRQPQLKVHQQTHTAAVRCSLCGKRFSQPERLQAHLRTHANTRT